MYKDSAVKKCQGIENDVKVVLNQEGSIRKMDYKSVKISERCKNCKAVSGYWRCNYRA